MWTCVFVRLCVGRDRGFGLRALLLYDDIWQDKDLPVGLQLLPLSWSWGKQIFDLWGKHLIMIPDLGSSLINVNDMMFYIQWNTKNRVWLTMLHVYKVHVEVRWCFDSDANPDNISMLETLTIWQLGLLLNCGPMKHSLKVTHHSITIPVKGNLLSLHWLAFMCFPEIQQEWVLLPGILVEA